MLYVAIYDKQGNVINAVGFVSILAYFSNEEIIELYHKGTSFNEMVREVVIRYTSNYIMYNNFDSYEIIDRTKYTELWHKLWDK